jgi:hypothetical protein
MDEESSTDPFFKEISQKYTPAEIAEIKKYLTEWDAAISFYFPQYFRPCSKEKF